MFICWFIHFLAVANTTNNYSSESSAYLLQEKVFLHEVPDSVRVVSVVRMNVEFERVKVATEKEKAIGEFDVLLLERDRLDFPHRVNGVEGDSNAESVAS